MKLSNGTLKDGDVHTTGLTQGVGGSSCTCVNKDGNTQEKQENRKQGVEANVSAEIGAVVLGSPVAASAANLDEKVVCGYGGNGLQGGQTVSGVAVAAVDDETDHETSLVCARMMASLWAAASDISTVNDGLLEINKCEASELMRWKETDGIKKVNLPSSGH